MNKTASDENSWLNILLGSGSVGAGTFALGRLLQELQQPDVSPVNPADTLTLDLPVEKKPQPPQGRPQVPVPIPASPEAKMASDLLMDTAALLGGAPLGYMGTKLLYDHVKKREMKRRVDDANQMYLQTLRAAQQNKMAEDAGSSTPLVDQFCGAIAIEVEKQASLMDKAKSWLNTGRNSLLAGGAGSAAIAGVPIWKGLQQAATANDPNGFAPASSTMNKGKEWMAVASILGSLMLGGGMIHAATKRQGKESKRMPTDVTVGYPEVSSPQGYPAYE